MNKIKILVSEDHTLVRQGLISMLENDPEFMIVGECEDGQSLIEKFNRTKPDIILTDISMPVMNGFDAAKEILSSGNKVKIIFLTAFESDEYIYKTLKIGAYGLISKQSLKGELIRTIKAVYEGNKYFPGRTEKDIRSIEKRFGENARDINTLPATPLENIEKEILVFIAQGFVSEEIAEKLSTSKRAVDHYRTEIMEKLNLKTLPQLIKYAVEFSFNEKE